jgi:hypothetical protein
MNQLTDYQLSQLTNQSECYIHTHPRAPFDDASFAELQSLMSVVIVNDGDTLTTEQSFVSIDPAGGAVTLILPPAIKSKEYHITMIGTGSLTITPDGADTIVGEPDAILYMKWTSLHLKADNNGNWIVV